MTLAFKNRTRPYAVVMAALLLLGGLFVQQGDVGAATSLTARVEASVNATLSNPLDLTTATAPLVSKRIQDFANGVGASQANVIWSDTRTLTTGATEDIDLIGGSLTDAFGVAVAPAKLRAVIITAAIGNTTNLTLFGDAASPLVLNTAATTYTLQPGGMFVATWPALAGIAVTATTADIIQVANAAGASATYSVIVIGTSS